MRVHVHPVRFSAALLFWLLFLPYTWEGNVTFTGIRQWWKYGGAHSYTWKFQWWWKWSKVEAAHCIQDIAEWQSICQYNVQAPWTYAYLKNLFRFFCWSLFSARASIYQSTSVNINVRDGTGVWHSGTLWRLVPCCSAAPWGLLAANAEYGAACPRAASREAVPQRRSAVNDSDMLHRQIREFVPQISWMIGQ